MLQLIVLFISGILNIFLGLVVYSKNPMRMLNRLFFLLTINFTLWSVVNYISINPILLPRLTWIRLVLFFAAPLSTLVFLTFTAFPSNKTKLTRRTWVAILAITGAEMVLVLTPLAFKGIENTNPVPNFGIAAFALFVIGMIGGGVLSLIKKHKRAVGRQREQLRLVLVGLSGTFSLIFLTNFVFVVLFRYSSLVPYGTTYTLIFTGAFAYAIIRHQLFDIRKAAARGLAYLLTFGVMAAGYIVLVTGITPVLFGQQYVLSGKRLALYTGLALLMAISLQSMKHFFDRVSNRVFFKDAYDPQKFLDKLNRILVAEVDLKRLAEGSASLIEDMLKADGCALIIKETDSSIARVIGTQVQYSRSWDPGRIESLIPRTNRKKVIVADYLGEDNQRLFEELNDLNIAVVVHLVAYTGSRSQRVGELILGLKRNGDPYTREDIEVLKIVANEMVIAIQNALRFEEIQQFNITLQKKVEDATFRLRETNKRLKLLDETKDDFISMASHQLRTPLTSVKGYLSLVLDGDAGPIRENQRKLLTQAFVSSQRMVYLIADLLNVSRLKTGKFIIESAPINLADVVQEEVSQLVETAQSRTLTLTYHKPSHFPVLMLDETKIRQVCMNFMDNAIYYTPAGGHINVEIIDTPNTIEFRVNDDGIGVPKDEQHHLFTKFYRAHNAQRARPDGTGLGLFMAQKVVVAQGGAIIFSSKENKGSTFGFTFPKEKLQVPTDTTTQSA